VPAEFRVAILDVISTFCNLPIGKRQKEKYLVTKPQVCVDIKFFSKIFAVFSGSTLIGKICELKKNLELFHLQNSKLDLP